MELPTYWHMFLSFEWHPLFIWDPCCLSTANLQFLETNKELTTIGVGLKRPNMFSIKLRYATSY